jgi:hypothetical protein
MIITPMDVIIVLFLSFLVGVLATIAYLELQDLGYLDD